MRKAFKYRVSHALLKYSLYPGITEITPQTNELYTREEEKGYLSQRVKDLMKDDSFFHRSTVTTLKTASDLLLIRATEREGFRASGV